MENTINQRIGEIIKKSGISLTAFAKLIGVAQASLRDCVKNGSEPKFSTLNKILIAKPMISAEWLLRGTGEMFLQSGDGKSGNKEELKKEIFRLETENKLLREFAGLKTTST